MNIRTLMTATCFAISTITGAAFAQDASQTKTDPAYFPTTANDLLGLIKNCETDDCMSYVSGVIGGISIYAIIAEKPSPFCFRGNVETETIREAIVSTIEATPSLKDQHPALAILTASGRHWPCVSSDDMKSFLSVPVDPVAQSQIDALTGSNDHSIVYGNLEADSSKTLIVFHDQNCTHCRRFSAELDDLAERGWKIMIYPVATTAEESAGYGAVEIALRDIAPEAARIIHDHTPEGVADITLATQLAEEAGVSSREILTAIAKSGAYASIENNTRAFFEMGGHGTPSWIVGTNMFSGFLTADGIESAVKDAEADAPAPSPKNVTPQAKMEQ